MNIHTLLLILHIVGSFGIGILIVLTIFAVLQKRASAYLPLALGIAWGSAFQLVTGSILMITLQPAPPLLAFCSKMGIYLSIVIASEAFLFYRIHQETTQPFPLRRVTSLISFAMITLVVTITSVYG